MGAGLAGYTIRRLLWAIPTLLLISIFVFWIIRLAPGDPVDSLLGQRYDEATAQRLKEKYGYDKPIYVQYVKYMTNLAHGDLGVSTIYQDFSVKEVIVKRMWISTRLGAMAVIIAFAIGVPVGIYAAMARGTFLDPLTISFWLFLDAFPTFVLTTLTGYLFAYKLHWVGFKWEGLASRNIILPVLIMSLPAVAGVARLMRASMLTVMDEDYVRTARAKGLHERTVVLTHIARNAMLPMITVFGLSLPAIVTGSLFVEAFFGIPGIAQLSLTAVQSPDFDIILALVLIESTLFVLANVLIDVLYAVIDPRIRVGTVRG